MMEIIGENQGLMMALLLSLIFGSVGLLVYALTTPGTRLEARERIQRYSGSLDQAVSRVEGVGVMREQHYSSIERLDALLRDNPLAAQAARDLARARVPLRVGEYFLLMLFLAGFGFYLAWSSAGNILAGVVVAALGGLAPKLYVSYRQGQRVRAVDDQLVDLLSLCSNSLRSGWGFLQALEHVSKELPAPISQEVTQMLEEVSLGATPEDALMALQQRVPSYDLELIVTAVLIQRRAGGNLAEMMDNIAHTIRERVALLGEIRTITAESRMSMWLLALLPIGLLLILSTANPTYIEPLMVDPRGRLILMGAGGLEFMGVLILRRLANIRV